MEPEQSHPDQGIEHSVEPAADPPEHHISAVHRVFWGRNRLRAFWRLLIFAVIVIVLQFAIGYVLHRGPIRNFTATGVIIQDSIAFFVTLLAAIVMARIERRSLADYGLPARGAFGVRFWEGLGWGFIAQCATMLILYAIGSARFHGFDQHGKTALYYGLMWGLAFIAVGFFEEFLFRGYPQFTLATGIGFWPAAIIISGLFWLGHMGNPGETWIGGLATAVAAMMFCVSLWLTGNLWFAIGLHAGWDWTETYFFGVPDSGMPATGHLLNSSLSGSKWISGGTVGPEGSVIALLVLLSVIGLLFLRFRHQGTAPYAQLAPPQAESTRISA